MITEPDPERVVRARLKFAAEIASDDAAQSPRSAQPASGRNLLGRNVGLP